MGFGMFITKILAKEVIVGKVIAGDYTNYDVTIGGKGASLSLGLKMFVFTKEDVESYETSDVTILGGKVSFKLKDGKKFLLNLNKEGYDAVKAMLF